MRSRRAHTSCKRAIDILLAAAMLPAVAPVVAGCAGAIWLSTGDAPIFVQRRVGRSNKPFKLLKLRTMKYGGAQGASITAGRDPRITRIGRVLRHFKIDELPQLWNVLVGDMSFVGPRPEVPAYVEQTPTWNRVLSVRPGITDIASLHLRNEAELLGGAAEPEKAYREIVLPTKLALAASGIDRQSLRYDLLIMARTALAVLPLPLFHTQHAFTSLDSVRNWRDATALRRNP